MPVRLCFIEMVLAVTISVSVGQAQPPDPGKASKRQQEQEQEIPTLEFLEFLGEWETEDGKWIDPEALEQMSLPDPEQNKDEENEKN